MIELNNVSRVYTLGGETIKALDKIDLSIKEGEFIAIMGPSGSGKSTFLNLIGGLDYPDSGQITVDNKDLSKMKDKELSRFRNQEIGFIFQAFHLQPLLTAVENVSMPLKFGRVKLKERRKRAQEILKMMGLEKRMKHKPSELSAGQRQRVSIARAMVTNPKILLADEPTGNLDSKNGKVIIELLKDLVNKKRLTVVMVTHDPEMAKLADRVINIHDGKIKT